MMAGIDSPRSLVQLELGHFEMLGVKSSEDRKKLFFLMQRVKKALEEDTMPSTAAAKVATTTNAATVQERDDKEEGKQKERRSDEFGISVETSSMKEPISPVTLSSPLVVDDGAFDVGGISSSSSQDNNNKNNNTRSYMEQMLKQRAMHRQQQQQQQQQKDAKVSASSVPYPSSRQSLMNRYHHHNHHHSEDRNKLGSAASDTRSYLAEESASDTSSLDATVSSEQRRNRRKSGIPMIRSSSSSSSRPHHHLASSSSSSTTKAIAATLREEEKDDVLDELDECLKSPIRDELDELLKSPAASAAATTPATSNAGRAVQPSVDARARRTSMHSRPTVKKTNQSMPRRYSNIPPPPVMDNKEEDDDESWSETSDLSNSLHSGSYSSLSSSISSKSHVRSKRSSRASTGTYSSRSSLSSSLNRMDENQNRNVRNNNNMKGGGRGARGGIDKASSTTASRTGKRRLSTIPSSRIAPTSPLSSLTSTQLDESITSQSGIPKLKKNVSINRRKTLGGGKISSTRPATADSLSTIAAKSITSSASKRKPRKMTTPRRTNQRGAPPSISPLKTRPLSPLRTVSRPRATSPRATSPLNRSRAAGKVKSPTHNSGAVFIHGVPEDTSWATQIARHREASNEEHDTFMADRDSESIDEGYEMRIRVVVRKRPMSKREASESGDVDVIHPLDYNDHGRVLVYQPKTKLDLTKEVEVSKFAFDNVYDEASNNMDIYNSSVKDLIPGVFHGKWASVFAYGRYRWKVVIINISLYYNTYT